MDPARLITMANEIGQFFRVRGDAAAIDGVEDHLRKFWDPRMRRAIVAVLDQGGEAMTPCVREAVSRLKSGPNAG